MKDEISINALGRKIKNKIKKEWKRIKEKLNKKVEVKKNF